MSSDFQYLERPELDNPIAVAGLPGIALIGKMSVEYLIKKFEAEKFAELRSDKFPGWVVREGGKVKDLRVHFYQAEPEGLDRTLILVTADTQASSSEAQYELSKEIVNVLADHGVETVITMAAFLESDGKESPVVGGATDSELAKRIEEHGVGLLTGGRIVGMNGLLVSLSAEKDMNGFCLLGTTEGKDKDPDAAKEVLTIFSEIYDFPIDLSGFEDEVSELPKFKPPKIKMPQVSGSETETSSYIR